MEKNDKIKLYNDVDGAFNGLSSKFLYLVEDKLKKNCTQEEWASFRKFILDLVNSEKRTILAKIEGRNYYHFTMNNRKGN